MRLPKTIRINNIPFKVVLDKTKYGASMSYPKARIVIGSKGDFRETLENFLHEVAEISSVERGLRAEKSKPESSENQYVFCGSHDNFRDMVSDVSIIVADMMKLKR